MIECPRCGAQESRVEYEKKLANRQHWNVDRKNRIMGPFANMTLHGVQYDPVLKEYSCIECGLQFSPEGKKVSIDVLDDLSGPEDWDLAGGSTKHNGKKGGRL